MKILTTLIMTLLMTSAVYAGACKEGDTCSKEDCLKLGNDMNIATDGENKGKCVKISQSASTDCKSIAQANGAKSQDSGSGAAPTAGETKTIAK
jgi:hypothetical protein